MQFNAIEERVLRYLESRFVAGGGFAHVTSDEPAGTIGFSETILLGSWLVLKALAFLKRSVWTE